MKEARETAEYNERMNEQQKRFVKNPQGEGEGEEEEEQPDLKRESEMLPTLDPVDPTKGINLNNNAT